MRDNMTNKLKVTIFICLYCVLIITTSGCKEKVEELKEGSTITPTNAPTVALTVEPTITSNEIDLEHDFKILKDCFLDYEFDVRESIQGKKLLAYHVLGEYDLDMDGEADKIFVKIDKQSIKSSIQVNGMEQELNLYLSFDGETRLLDIDQKDDFIELAIFDDGPSGDPVYHIFRYDGKEVISMNDIEANSRMDGQGRLITGFDIAWQFEPSFYSAWFELENLTFNRTNNDVKKYLNKTYDFIGGDAYFIPKENISEDIEVKWDEIKWDEIKWDETRYVEAGKVKIMDILFVNENLRTLNFYYVELESGEKGLLYFWMGD